MLANVVTSSIATAFGSMLKWPVMAWGVLGSVHVAKAEPANRHTATNKTA